MAQTGIEAGSVGGVGRIFTDRYQGHGYACDFNGCNNPCAHCKEACRGKISWDREDFLQERIVYCTAQARHPYKVMQSG